MMKKKINKISIAEQIREQLRLVNSINNGVAWRAAKELDKKDKEIARLKKRISSLKDERDKDNWAAFDALYQKHQEVLTRNIELKRQNEKLTKE